MPSRFLHLSLLLVPLCIAVGCGGRPSRVPVSGKVLVDGKPLESGTIIFVPDTGRQSSGLVKDGKFTLGCFQADDGALVGKHKVSVSSTLFQNRETAIKYLVPPKYGHIATSQLTAEIKDATDSLVVELTWKGNKPSEPYVEPLANEGGDLDEAMRARFKKNKAESKNDQKK
jgi:hypothetical protein